MNNVELLYEHEVASGAESGHKVCVVSRCQMEEKEMDEEMNIQVPLYYTVHVFIVFTCHHGKLLVSV